MTTEEKRKALDEYCNNHEGCHTCPHENNEYCRYHNMELSSPEVIDGWYAAFFENKPENVSGGMDASEAKTLTKVEKHAKICKQLNSLYERKNHDYGDSFGITFREEGMAMVRIRLGDKFNRFKALSRGADAKVKDESIRDTLLDLANYAIMTVIEMEMEHNDNQ